MGRVYYQKKIAEGKTPKEAIRALKRRISDAIHKSLIADAAKTTTNWKRRVREDNQERLFRQRGQLDILKGWLFGSVTPEP